MSILTCDERRRVILPQDMAEEGEQFVAIKVRQEIILKKLPKDPIKALQKEGRKLKGLSMKHIRKLIEEQAMEEIRHY